MIGHRIGLTFDWKTYVVNGWSPTFTTTPESVFSTTISAAASGPANPTATSGRVAQARTGRSMASFLSRVPDAGLREQFSADRNRPASELLLFRPTSEQRK